MKLLQRLVSVLIFLPLFTNAALTSENYRVEGQSVGAPSVTQGGSSGAFTSEFESGSLYILPAPSTPAPLPGSGGGTRTDPEDVLGKTDSVKICHSAGGKQYVVLSNVQILVSLINAQIDVSLKGHAGHADDIIPPFRYNFGDGVREYPGHNWNESTAAIYEEECVSVKPTEPTSPAPTREQTPPPVQTPDDQKPGDRQILCSTSANEGRFTVFVVTNPPCDVSSKDKVDVSVDSGEVPGVAVEFSDVVPNFPSPAVLFVSPVTVFAVNEEGEQVNDLGGPVVISIQDERVLGLSESNFVITQLTEDGTAWEKLPFDIDGDTIRITVSRPGELLIWFLPAVAEAATSTPAIAATLPVVEIEIDPTLQRLLSALGLLTGFLFALLQLSRAPFSLTNVNHIFSQAWHNLIALLTFKKRRQPWGTVYDSKTKAPLDPAYVELFDADGVKVAEAITDLDGRYGFLVPDGSYRMQVRKTNYVFPSRLSTLTGQDVIYRDLYFGELFQTASLVVHDIPMDPQNFDWNQHEKLRTRQMKFFSIIDPVIIRFLDLSFFVGFGFMIWQFLHHRTFLAGALLGCYIVLLIYRFIGTKPPLYGYITKNAKPLAFAVVHVYEGNRKIISKVTDAHGRYIALVADGIYTLSIDERVDEENYQQAFRGEVKARKGIINSKLRI